MGKERGNYLLIILSDDDVTCVFFFLTVLTATKFHRAMPRFPFADAAVLTRHLVRRCSYFYNLDSWKQGMSDLRDAFPPHWHHATAVKNNPLTSMLKIVLSEGHGGECASMGEVLHCLKVGFEGADVVFDSPCKTIPEIKYALENKVMLNMDNMQEMERVKVAVAGMSEDSLQGCVIGLRINPLVGSGAVANLSVSTRKSKFGVICPVGGGGGDQEVMERAAVVKALVENDFVTAVHVHTGSGGMTIEQMADGAAGAANLALEVNKLRSDSQRKIDVIDIGGGLPGALTLTEALFLCILFDSWQRRAEHAPPFPPSNSTPTLPLNNTQTTQRKCKCECNAHAHAVSYGKEQDPTFAKYSSILRERAPSLFDGVTFRRVVTEFGNMMNCRHAFYASVCEVTKPGDAGGRIAMIHAGSDQFLRACYAAHMRKPHPVSVFHKDGVSKSGAPILHDIAGPLCFAGDVVCTAVQLPQVEVGDIVVLDEAGGNTHGLKTMHCSRRFPPIFGYERGQDDSNSSDGLKFTQLSSGWSYDQLLSLW